MEQRENPFPFSIDNKRYHTLNFHYQKKFSGRVFKAAINAGFTCPTLDGTKGVGGCSFCLGGAGEFANAPTFSVTEQLEKEKERIFKKYGEVPLIAYFQVHTNTYAPVSVLEAKYREALSFPGVIGISIGTRADCISEKIVDLLKTLSKECYLTLELGLQTVHNETAKTFGRGYDYDVFLDAYSKLKKAGIRVCVHLINGLPGETRDMMVETARVAGRLRPDAVKIHLLHILKGTRIEEDFVNGALTPLKKDQYIDVVCRQLEVLPPETVIERITGDGAGEKLLAPKWSLDKISVLAAIDKELFMRGTYQGIFYER